MGWPHLTAWKGYAERTWEPRSSFVLGSVVTNALLRYESRAGLAFCQVGASQRMLLGDRKVRIRDPPLRNRLHPRAPQRTQAVAHNAQ